jgi:radical SAM superfamily enzyme YgiQ (UPF0313 family)
LEELGLIEEKYVFFADDESLLDTKRMEVLADLIGQAGIRKRFFLYGRSDTIARHPELVEKWKKIGLERVFVGLEFIRDEDLNLIRKGSTVENNVRAVQVLETQFRKKRLRRLAEILPRPGSQFYRFFSTDSSAGYRPV